MDVKARGKLAGPSGSKGCVQRCKIQLADVGTGARRFNMFNSPDNGREGMICELVHDTELWGAQL